ncbi:uncharacterized protein LOC121415496 [Lytechinus variegatus]|uniref:uncharacterized protein LOC121415496 n=1 Tax=Lytechinus variegatus TaxID=7654 RepID=UPI001BB18ABA|nr:uncharacterized protein LOC121415496 [Lytechinus variegatus]
MSAIGSVSISIFLFILTLPCLNYYILFISGSGALVGATPDDSSLIKSWEHDNLDNDKFITKGHVHRRTRSTNCRPNTGHSSCETVSAIPRFIREKYNLDPFYEKYTHANRIPIISSRQVSYTALERACYTVRFLMMDRADIREALHNGGARVSVLGINELTNEIPEYRYLDDSWNERTRSLGGTPENPVTVTAEENLICADESIDRWSEEDIIVHEFVHAIHLVAIDFIDTSFKDRLKNAFLDAFRSGLWSNHMGGTNINEYLAEGAQSFFNVNVHQDTDDDLHNNISTREALYGYDRQLYDILMEIFPCGNQLLDRCRNQSETISWPVRRDCVSSPSTPSVDQYTVLSTLETPSRTNTTSSISMGHTMSTPSESTRSTIVTDEGSVTRVTVSEGNPRNMSSLIPGCSDRISLCGDLVSVKECNINPIKRSHCIKTCQLCPGCHDYHRLCGVLSEKGFCRTKIEYMFSVCPKSCNVCKK